MRSHSNFLPTLLPTLVLPALLLAAASAQAAELSISNGFLTAKEITSVGWNFSMHAEGIVAASGQNAPTAVDLSCEVDVSSEHFNCIGELEIGDNLADIRLGYADGVVRWAIEAGAPTLFNDIHEQWGEEVLPNSVGIGVLNWHNGFEWRQWYYSESWAECYGNITGLQYGDIWLE